MASLSPREDGIPGVTGWSYLGCMQQTPHHKHGHDGNYQAILRCYFGTSCPQQTSSECTTKHSVSIFRHGARPTSLPLHSVVMIYRRISNMGSDSGSERDLTIHNHREGQIHGELTGSQDCGIGGGDSGGRVEQCAGSATGINSQTDAQGASSDGTVRSGTTTGRCKSPASLVLTLRGRPVRVAFGLLSDACGQTLVIILHGVHNRFAQAGC